MVKQSLKIAISIYKPSTPRWLLSLQSKISVWLCGEKNPWIKPTTWERWFQNEHFISMQIEKDSVNLCVCDDIIMSPFQLECDKGKSQVFESKWREVLCSSTTWDVMKWAEEITIRKYDISLFSRSFQTTATVLLSAVFCLSGFAFVQVGSLPLIGSQKLKIFVVPWEEKQVKSGKFYCTVHLSPPSKR